MNYVYLLKLKNGSCYTGSTPDIETMIKKHQQGFCESTKDLRPVELVWACKFKDKLKALRFEKYLKTGFGQAFRNKRLI